MYFVSDVDGTLLAQPGDRVIEGLPEALSTLQRCGVTVVLASNRALHDVTLAAARLKLVDYFAISSGGRYVTQMNGSKVSRTIYQNFDVRKGIQYARNGKRVIFQDVDGVLRYIDWATKPKDIWQSVLPISESKLRNTPKSTFIIEFDGTWRDAQKLADSNWYPWQYNGNNYLQDIEINKGVGLLELVKARGSKGIAAIGDDTNDYTMFKLASDVYVMGNAKASLLNILDMKHTIVSNVESGGAIDAIAHLIDKYPELQINLKRLIKAKQPILNL